MIDEQPEPAERRLPMFGECPEVEIDEIADLLEIKGDNPFRIRAYRNAARTIGDLGGELRDQVEKGEDLTAIARLLPRSATLRKISSALSLRMSRATWAPFSA